MSMMCRRAWRALSVLVLSGLWVVPHAQAASEQSIRIVQEQYVAFYGRPGDSGGVVYWADQLELQGGLGAIQAAFADSDEFRTLIIPGDATSVAELSTEELRSMINNLYQNMFGRDGDPGGLDFWTSELESEKRTLVDISTAIADGAAEGGDDNTILSNRVTLAQRITDAINAEGLAYGNDQIATARNFLFSNVTSTSDDPATIDINTLLSSLGGSSTNQSPVANAGADQSVTAGDVVILDGTGSSDPDGSIVSYSWKQLTATAMSRKLPRIINGQKATSGQFPWQVALLTDPNDAFNSQNCGGSIIHEKWILTAAHCYDPQVADTYVAAGSLNLNNLNPSYTVKVKKWILHPNYDAEAIDNDIALLELEAALDLTGCGDACATIGIVTKDNEATVAAVSTAAFVSGWGNTSTDGEVFDPDLLWVQLSIMDCLAPPSQHLTTDITDNMFCAAVPTFDKDSCQGDSGGPLAVPNGNGYLLAGVVSWGTGCAAEGYPGVFAKVANYTQWIQDNTNGDCCTSGGGNTGGGVDTTVTLSNATSAQASFTAPLVTETTTLSFELMVTDDASATATDRVDIQVMPAN